MTQLLTKLRLALLLAALLGGCAAYHVGNQTLYPAGIRTVYVPMFESTSFRRNLGERLTEAVQKEIELRTPFKVVGNANADSVLTGRIVGESKHLLVNAITGDPREVQVSFRVHVSWVDRQGAMLRQAQSVALPSEMTDVGATSDLVPEVGQSVATAQQQAIVRVAQQIVGLMEAPW